MLAKPCKTFSGKFVWRPGYNAVPAQKPVNVAMYAAGGAVAGAVVGAGAMNLITRSEPPKNLENHSQKKRFPNGSNRKDGCIIYMAPGGIFDFWGRINVNPTQEKSSPGSPT